MKNVLAILLSLTIGLQHCVQLGLFAWYSFNKRFITEQLCVNKSKPEMLCEGKCFLGKQLKKAEEGERNAASKILKEKQEYVSNSCSSELLKPILTSTNSVFPAFDFRLPGSPVLDVIYPPG